MQWRPVLNYSLYEVSEAGEIRNAKTGHIKSQRVSKRGYRVIGTTGHRVLTVHRLVAEAFLPKPLGANDVCHINGDPLDNRVANLRWGTRRENVADTFKHGTVARGRIHGMAKITEEDVIEMRRRRASGWLLKELSAAYGLSLGHVSEIVNGNLWAHV